MTRKQLATIAGTLVLLYLSAKPARVVAAVSAIRHPNLIFIYTDDQRFDALRANQNTAIRTPHLDRLCRRGVRFTNAHVIMSLCSPSRAAALTGRYGSANGVTALNQPLRPGEQTFAQLLKRAGYQTAFVGKWHLNTRVSDAGFDFRCYFRGNGTYFRRKTWDNDHGVNRLSTSASVATVVPIPCWLPAQLGGS